MRKDNGLKKKLEGFYYETFTVKGLNLDRLIENAKKRGITLYKTIKPADNILKITVKKSQSKKLFALFKELCYNNVVKEKESGRVLPLVFFLGNIGVLLGAVFFVVTALLFDNVIIKFRFSGSGEVYSQQVINYLEDLGIKKYSRFSDFKLNELEDKILSSLDSLSFVSCKKNGNALDINLIASSEKKKGAIAETYLLSSPFSGVVEEIRVYRGTPSVKKGDRVKKGDTLVEGIATVKENVVKVKVIATVTVKRETVFTYVSEKENEEDTAYLIAAETFGAPERYSVDIKKEKGKYYYFVNLSYLQTIKAE